MRTTVMPISSHNSRGRAWATVAGYEGIVRAVVRYGYLTITWEK